MAELNQHDEDDGKALHAASPSSSSVHAGSDGDELLLGIVDMPANLEPLIAVDLDFLAPSDLELCATAATGLDDVLAPIDPRATDEGGIGGIQPDDLDLLSEVLLQPDSESAPLLLLPEEGLQTSEEVRTLITSGTSASGSNSEDGTDAGTPIDHDSLPSMNESQAYPLRMPPAPISPQRRGRNESADGEQGDGLQEKRRIQVADRARRFRHRKKNELVVLQKEATYLSSQLDFLRSKHNLLRDDGSVAEWTDAAISQRHKRRQAEQLNEQLRQALFEQSGFVRSVKAAFPRPILPNMELNMCTLLHMYTHLSTDPHSRVRDLKAVCNNAKLDLARQIVLSETESLPFATPTIEWRQLDMRGVKGFGVTTVAVYAFNTRDAKKVFQATCDTILGFGGVWPSYSLVNSSAQVVDRPPTEHHIRYGVSKQIYQSDITGDQVVVEGRELSCSRLTGRGGVFCWDHVDVDDLHPLKESTAVRCNRTGAVVVRPEICEDGVERVVCRNICTKVHTVDVSKLTKHVAQFSRSRLQGVQACGSMVYEIIKGEASEVSTVSN